MVNLASAYLVFPWGATLRSAARGRCGLFLTFSCYYTFITHFSKTRFTLESVWWHYNISSTFQFFRNLTSSTIHQRWENDENVIMKEKKTNVTKQKKPTCDSFIFINIHIMLGHVYLFFPNTNKKMRTQPSIICWNPDAVFAGSDRVTCAFTDSDVSTVSPSVSVSLFWWRPRCHRSETCQMFVAYSWRRDFHRMIWGGDKLRRYLTAYFVILKVYIELYVCATNIVHHIWIEI